MESDESVQRIRQRMAELRRELSHDFQDVGRSARAMTDVGLYVRRFPWASVAIALAAGYLLVPRKKEVIHPDAAMLARLVRKNQVRVDTSPREHQPTGILKNVLAAGLMAGARLGMNVVLNRMTSAANSSDAALEATPAVAKSWTD